MTCPRCHRAIHKGLHLKEWDEWKRILESRVRCKPQARFGGGEKEKYLKRQLACSLPYDFGAFNDKMQLRLSAGEECDVIFTAPWINSYANNVANGVLAPLDDLLLNHAPGLWGSMPPTTWDAARVNGVIYGVINQQIFPKPWGVHPRKDLAEKYGLDLDSVTKWEDMEPWLADVRDGEGITPVFVAAPGRGLFLAPVLRLRPPG